MVMSASPLAHNSAFVMPLSPYTRLYVSRFGMFDRINFDHHADELASSCPFGLRLASALARRFGCPNFLSTNSHVFPTSRPSLLSQLPNPSPHIRPVGCEPRLSGRPHALSIKLARPKSGALTVSETDPNRAFSSVRRTQKTAIGTSKMPRSAPFHTLILSSRVNRCD